MNKYRSIRETTIDNSCFGGEFVSSFEEITNVAADLWNLLFTRWLSEELFSFSWFVILGSMFLIYIALFLLIDKSRLREIILYGALLSVAFGYIDVIGTNVGLWEYKTHFLPFVPSLFPFTYTVHPIVHLLIYQYTDSWRSFAIWNTLGTVFFAFIAHPFYVWSQVLWLGKWNYVYSFILGVIITSFVRAVVIWLANIEQKHVKESSRASLLPKLQPVMKLSNEDNENPKE